MTMQERIKAVVVSGLLPDEDDLIRECARRYVAIEHRKFMRSSARGVERLAKVKQDTGRQAFDVVRAALGEIEAGLREDWSEELLASTFVVGGVRVTWENATVDQHEARAEMLEGMAAGDLQTASIHRRAVHDIREVGVFSLGEVSRVPC